MTVAHSYVTTARLRAAVKGHEIEILNRVGIPWRTDKSHIACPYPEHADNHPSWRWDERKKRAYCTCIEGSHSIIDVLMKLESIDFDAAKIRAANLLKRVDLIKERSARKPTGVDGGIRPERDRNGATPGTYTLSDYATTLGSPNDFLDGLGQSKINYKSAGARSRACSDTVRAIGCDAEGTSDPIAPNREPATDPGDDGAAAERAETINWVNQQFAEASPIGGTPAERYLSEHRGLRGPWPAALRWKPDYRIKSDAVPQPCLLASVTNLAGEIVGLHSIELDPRTAAKSQRIPKPKLSRGPIGEGSAFLGNPQEPAATLVIGEGLETTLTRALIGPCDAHACLGALRFIKPGPHHRRVEILADTDKRDAARRLARRYAASAGAYVVTVPDSLGPKADVNDALRSLGSAAVLMAIEDAERFTNDMAQSGPSDFDLKIGSDIEIARRIVERLEELYGPVIVSEGRVWRFDRTHWAALEDDHLARFVHRADGAQYIDAGDKNRIVRLNKSRVTSILDAAMKYRQRQGFFEKPPCGINCASGFIRIETDGSAVLQPHARQWRQRHVVRGQWQIEEDPEMLANSRLARYLRDAFAGDSDASDKINLLGEVAGCTALGWGTRVRNPKAIVTYSEEGATGKSTYLRLLRSLPNPDAVASVPPGKFGDEKYAWRLIGRVLNASDELPDRAVRSDVFKRMITGEPVPARDVYRSATDFSPVALHVFSTNVLPAFSGGVDGGTVRRLLPLEFTHVVPEAERDPDLPDRILSDEADLFLHFAVEGACRLVRNRDFTVPASSRDLLARWVLSADSVRAWAAARLEVTADEHTISVAALFSDFRNWAEAQGLKAEFLPSVIAFGKRLRSAAPGVEYHRSDGSAYRNARICARQ